MLQVMGFCGRKVDKKVTSWKEIIDSILGYIIKII
jgi:hypothetical protein